MGRSSIASIVLCLALAFSVCKPTKAAEYILGYPRGWDTDLMSSFYMNWCSYQTFYPGDVLIFNVAERASLVEITKEVFESSAASPYIHKYPNGPSTTRITLDEPGTRYFSSDDDDYGTYMGYRQIQIDVHDCEEN